MKYNSQLSTAIKEGRKAKKITQAELAKQIGKSKKTIERYENPNDLNSPNLEVVNEIGKILGRDLSAYIMDKEIDDIIRMPELLYIYRDIKGSKTPKDNYSIQFDRNLLGKENMENVFGFKKLLQDLIKYKNDKSQKIQGFIEGKSEKDFWESKMLPLQAALRENGITIYFKDVAYLKKHYDSKVDPNHLRSDDIHYTVDDQYFSHLGNYIISDHVIEPHFDYYTYIYILSDNNHSPDTHEVKFFSNTPFKLKYWSPKAKYFGKTNHAIVFSNDIFNDNSLQKEVNFQKDCFMEGVKEFMRQTYKSDKKTFDKLMADEYWGSGEPVFDGPDHNYNGQEGGHPLIASFEEESLWGHPENLNARNYWGAIGKDDEGISVQYGFDRRALNEDLLNHGKVAMAAIMDGYLSTIVKKDYGVSTGYDSSKYESITNVDSAIEQLGRENVFVRGNPYVDHLIDRNDDFKKYMIESGQIFEKTDAKGGK